MYTLITIMSYLLDMLIITIYLNNILKDRKSIYRFYFPVLLFTEILIYINEVQISERRKGNAAVITILISVITTFALTMFFKAKALARIFTAISFQILALVSEYIFTFVVNIINPGLLSLSDHFFLVCIMNLGSKIILLLFAIITGLFWKRRENYPTEYSLLMLATPIISLIIIGSISFVRIPSDSSLLIFVILICCIIALNLVNYILISRIYQSMAYRNEKQQLIERLRLQNDNYTTLSESYKQSRRIIHDVKKHYFTIGEYAQRNNDQEVSDYVYNAIKDIETTYIKYNTGNLVIDSMLTSYDSISTQNKVAFSADLHVNYHHIPVRDYDLSIIIGNLLDNAIHAAPGSTDAYIHISIETRDDKRFLISCENSVSDIMPINVPESSAMSYHGYGLSNIRSAVEKYYGFMSVDEGNPWTVAIVIPIMTDRSICPPPPPTPTIVNNL